MMMPRDAPVDTKNPFQVCFGRLVLPTARLWSVPSACQILTVPTRLADSRPYLCNSRRSGQQAEVLHRKVPCHPRGAPPACGTCRNDVAATEANPNPNPPATFAGKLGDPHASSLVSTPSQFQASRMGKEASVRCRRRRRPR